MAGDPLPDDDHVVRYCRPAQVSSHGLPLPEAFELRTDEAYLSVNWLEYFQESDLTAAVQRVREAFQTKRFRIGRRGLFAVLDIGDAKTAVYDRFELSLRFEHAPSRDDPSHAAILGYGFSDFAVAVELAALAGSQGAYPALQ